jgi:hypothetical protein
MAIDAIFTGIMILRVNTRKLGTLAGGVGQIAMAPEALGSAGIYCQGFRVIGMINCRSVAVFTLYDRMGRIEYGFYVLFMAFLAILPASVFYLEVLPFIKI